jgi:hypothetical protein
MIDRNAINPSEKARMTFEPLNVFKSLHKGVLAQGVRVRRILSHAQG